MKKLSLYLVPVFLCISSLVSAQMPYDVTVLKEPYVPLTGATSINDTIIWNPFTNFTVPLGFNMRFDTIVRDRIIVEEGSSINTDSPTVAVISGFSLADASLADRGELTGVRSLSPIRYTLTGTPGSRILKLEVFNAGFDDELNAFGTMDDSVDIQYWLYEGSNIVELRYGPSQVTNPDIYFETPNEPLVGYGKDIDSNGNGALYVLVGDPLHPTLDSIVISGGSPVHIDSTFLNSYPKDSTVYRFTPKGTGVKNISFNVFRIYPTKCQNEVFVENEQHDGTVAYTIVSTNGAATNIKGNLEQNKTIIDVSTLPPGMYLLQLQSKIGSMVQKLVKE